MSVDHHPRRHAASRTDAYLFSQLIPYIGNKRKLLPLIARGLDRTDANGTFVDLFTGSTVVGRMAKMRGFRVVANDWEPYAAILARATVALNSMPEFEGVGGVDGAFSALNALSPVRGYLAGHYCPRDDAAPDFARERMFFTQANGRRMDAAREAIQAWTEHGLITDDELAVLLASFVYGASYVSNTSGVFKGFHRGWGGASGVALYRILSEFNLRLPVLYDNGQANVAIRADALELARSLSDVCGGIADVVYLDPPYNQHPYGSNYHLLNTIALWDKPPVSPVITPGTKSAIRPDWVSRRSLFNSKKTSLEVFRRLINDLEANWLLVSYSTEGNISTDELLRAMTEVGATSIVTQPYKRYRVSPTRPSPRPQTVEFVAVINLRAKGKRGDCERLNAQLNAVARWQHAQRSVGRNGTHAARHVA